MLQTLFPFQDKCHFIKAFYHIAHASRTWNLCRMTFTKISSGQWRFMIKYVVSSYSSGQILHTQLRTPLQGEGSVDHLLGTTVLYDFLNDRFFQWILKLTVLRFTGTFHCFQIIYHKQIRIIHFHGDEVVLSTK